MPTHDKTKTIYIPMRVKAIDGSEGMISGMASTTDIDLVGDRILAGAFDKSIKERMSSSKRFFPLLSEHRVPVGKITTAKSTDSGLYIEAKFLENHNAAQDTYVNVKEGIQDSFSVGFQIVDAKFVVEDEKEIFEITEANLKEVSVVSSPANPEATIDSVKSLFGNSKKDKTEKTWLDFYVEKQKADKEKFWQTLANKMNQPQ